MVGIVELAQLCVLTVNSQGVLGQVVGTNGEECSFLSQLVSQNSSSGSFDHDADGHFLGGIAFSFQLVAYLPDS